MPSSQYAAMVEETKKSLVRLQDFSPEVLVQEKELGLKNNFREVLPAAQNIVSLTRTISLETINAIPEDRLQGLRNRFNSCYQVFERILKYSPENGPGERTSLIQQAENEYAALYADSIGVVALSIGRTADFKRLESEGRAAIQSISDASKELLESLSEREAEGDRILAEIKKVAAEQGVTQQAVYFRDEAANHNTQAEIWQNRLFQSAGLLALYAVATLFIHKISLFTPTSTYETVQLALSKVLIFGVLSFVVFLCARNYSAHKHNSVVNKHRQNGLMTFKALVDAAMTKESKDVILNHAASSIFAPQPTGYGGDATSEGASSKSVVELVGSAVNSKD